MKFIRIMATSVNEIIQRLEELNTNPSETFMLTTNYTFDAMIKAGSDVEVLTENPITHQKYMLPITAFSLFTIYKLQTVPITLMDKTKWTAITSFKSGALPEKSYLANVVSASGNLVLVELNDSKSDLIELNIDN